MKALITGAGGFLGQHLVKFLKKKDCEIYNLGYKPVKNCFHFPLSNLSDRITIKKTVAKIKPDYLFHLAGSANTSSDIVECFSVNTFFAEYLLDAINYANLQHHTKIVIVGTAAEYGPINEDQLPISESMLPKPETLYGISKLAQTNLASSWQDLKNLLVIIRPFNIIGSNMPKHLALGSFFEQINSITDKGVLRTGNLNTERDFIDAVDVVHIMWKLVNNPKAYGEIINLCTGAPVSMKVIVDYLIKYSKRTIKLETERNRMKENDIKLHYGDNSKLKKLIGEYEFISWRKTISGVIDFYE